MNILQVCLSYGWGGLEMYPLILSKSLIKKGHRVSLLGAKDSPFTLQAEKENLQVMNLRTRIKYVDFFAIRKIKQIIQNLKPEIIHLHCAADLWLVIPAVSRSGLNPRLVFTSQMGSVYPKKDILHRFLYQKLDLAIAISEDSRQKMLASCPVLPEKTVTVYYGTDLERFNPQKYTSGKIRKELGIAKNELVVGTVGRMEPKKGQKELLLAAREVIKDFPKTKFLIIGAVEKGFEHYERELKKIAADTLLNGKVTFTGPRQDIPEILAGIDIFVLASHCEAFGLVLAEAMAMGKAVIGTNAGGVSEIIENGKNGLLVPPADWKGLAGALQRLISDRSLCLVLSQNARKTVEEKFSLDKHLQQIEKVYSSK